VRYGRPVEVTPPLFPGYAFVMLSEQRWWGARWAPGVLGLIMDGVVPARVPDTVVTEIRGRERGGFVVLPRAPAFRPRQPGAGGARRLFRTSGDLCRNERGQRVEVLLTLLGSLRRVTLTRRDVEAIG
jgi:hypothetical protein